MRLGAVTEILSAGTAVAGILEIRGAVIEEGVGVEVLIVTAGRLISFPPLFGRFDLTPVFIIFLGTIR